MLPLAIVVIGVGDGPWDDLEELEFRMPPRRFDNWHFFSHTSLKKTCNKSSFEAEFAQVVLGNLPDQATISTLTCTPTLPLTLTLIVGWALGVTSR